MPRRRGVVACAWLVARSAAACGKQPELGELPARVFVGQYVAGAAGDGDGAEAPR